MIGRTKETSRGSNEQYQRTLNQGVIRSRLILSNRDGLMFYLFESPAKGLETTGV